MPVNIACKLCVCGCVLYSKCIKKIFISLCVSNSKNILCKILCSQYGSSFNSSVPKKTCTIYWLNYQVCILNTRKSFCNSQIVHCIEKHSKYFVEKSCKPLLHMLQHYIANSVTWRTQMYLMHSLWSGTFKSLITKEIHCKAGESG